MEPVQSRIKSKSIIYSCLIAFLSSVLSFLSILMPELTRLPMLTTLLGFSSSTKTGLFLSGSTLTDLLGFGLWNLYGHVVSLFLQASPNLQSLGTLPGATECLPSSFPPLPLPRPLPPR
jgi:hypothetical protein